LICNVNKQKKRKIVGERRKKKERKEGLKGK